MSRVEALYRHFTEAPERMIPCKGIRTDDALQPRKMEAVHLRQRNAEQRAGEEFRERLSATLRAHESVQLTPIWVAETRRGLFVVDGHNRLSAYRRVKREEVPARVVAMGWDDAVCVSKLVNIPLSQQTMHPAQVKEALWQRIGIETDQGTRGLPKGVSLATLAEQYGVPKATVGDWVKRAESLADREFDPEDCDPGTRWVYRHKSTRYVGNQLWDRMDADARAEWQAERCAQALLKTLERWPPEVAERAATKLAEMGKATPRQLAGIVAGYRDYYGTEVDPEGAERAARDERIIDEF